MSEITTPVSGGDSVRLELSSRTLQRLLSSGLLHPADFRCLDCATKHCVWRLVARRCAHSLSCNGCCAECHMRVEMRTATAGNGDEAHRFPGLPDSGAIRVGEERT